MEIKPSFGKTLSTLVIWLSLNTAIPACELHNHPQTFTEEDVIDTQGHETDDSLEDLNRLFFSLHELLDGLFLEPIAKIYQGITPEFLRTRVSFALRNLKEPAVFANNLLQGNINDAGETFSRFMVNSTIGLAGTFDMSTHVGIPYRSQTLEQTLSYWDVPAGPYLFIPLLGPFNARSLAGKAGDAFLDPFYWWAHHHHKGDRYSYIRAGIEGLDARSNNLEMIDDLRRNSLDYYTAVRTWYIEHQKTLHKDYSPERLLGPQPEEDNHNDY